MIFEIKKKEKMEGINQIHKSQFYINWYELATFHSRSQHIYVNTCCDQVPF